MISAVVAWLVLAALLFGGIYVASRYANRPPLTARRESHRDRYGRPLAWKQTPQEAEELEFLEALWRKPTTNEPRRAE